MIAIKKLPSLNFFKDERNSRGTTLICPNLTVKASFAAKSTAQHSNGCCRRSLRSKILGAQLQDHLQQLLRACSKKTNRIYIHLPFSAYRGSLSTVPPLTLLFIAFILIHDKCIGLPIHLVYVKVYHVLFTLSKDTFTISYWELITNHSQAL